MGAIAMGRVRGWQQHVGGIGGIGGAARCGARVALTGGLAGLLLAAALSGSAVAQSGGPIQIELMATLLSKDPGGIDPRAEKLDRELKGEFKYQSLKVLKSKELTLGLDEVGRMSLPNGKRLEVRPMLVDAKGALLAVEVEGSVQTDLRVKSDHLVIIGTERHEKGKLVLSLVPRF